MRNIIRVLLFAFATPLVVLSQDKPPKPRVSPDALTGDQIAIYQAVLKDFNDGAKSPLNLANTTEPLERSGTKGCVNWVPASDKNSAPIVHRLDALVRSDSKLALVESKKHQQAIDDNDPQKLLKSAIDDGKKVDEDELSESVKRAVASALFTFYEIAFDKEHKRALLSYSFVCGGLCGHGETMVLRRSGKNWKIAKRCREWVS